MGAAVLGGPVMGVGPFASVTILLFLDPFLIRVVAFQLSVLATGGIVWLRARLPARPGPELVRVAAATTASAQLAVSPLLAVVFGPVPLAALPANLLAGPASGPIMMWGWTGGLLAGASAADRRAGFTRRPCSWSAGSAVAHVTASGPFVTVGIVGIVALMVAVGLLLTGRRYVRPIAGVIAAVVLIGAWVAVPGPEPGSLGSGLVLHTTTPVVLELDGPRRSRDVLERFGMQA